MHFYNRFADRQQPQSLTLRPNLLKGVEDFLEVFRCDPDAGVADLDLQGPRFGVECSDRNCTPFGRKL